MINIQQTKPSDWKYVSEGGATIVFSYAGPAHPEFDGTVLRLRKSSVSTGKLDDEQTKDLCAHNDDAEPEPADPTVEYQERCMERLIPVEYLPRLQNVCLDRSWLEQLAKLQNPVRPEDRREKDEVNVNRKRGVLATDLVGGSWLAVEIKPKWAFLPSPVHLSDETRFIKTHTCRFCMHSHLRAQKGKQVPANYCPLDLFSGDEKRIRNAICNLWNGWVTSNGTANNLKVFARGKFVMPSETKLMLAGSANEAEVGVIRDAFVAALSRPLLDTPVLRIISDLQRGLDALDIEGLSKLWKIAESSAQLDHSTSKTDPKYQAAPSSAPFSASSAFVQASEPDISDWVKFLDSYLSVDKPALDHTNPPPENLREYLMSYLLSATFKDCSIIVKLPLLDPSNRPQRISETSVTVIDLDPKKMKKLHDWEQLDREIVLNYSTSALQKKVCIDSRQPRR